MSRAKGNIAEDMACDFLRNNAFQIVQRNFYTKFGEIDIIAMKRTTLHFIEVKSAKSYELAMQNITDTKLQRILRSVAVYLQAHQIDLDYSVDALIVVEKNATLVENITL